ncbi:MAG: hypothetical protein KAG66_16455, partial [Methylococcales bacterium]|nr:hypothetical protein [Methylococcales bacterium]
IELQEIDLALESFPGVEQAVTMVYEDKGRGKWLAAFVKVARPDQFPMAELEKQAHKKLPDYMVPAVFVPVAEWSYTPSGKLDRNALPRPELGARLVAEFQPLETKPQQALGEIWQRLLNLQRVGLDHNFFELGGDSLLGVHLIHEISQYFGTELSLATLVRQPTIRGLASILDENSIDEAQLEGFRCLQLIQQGDPAVPPLFMIHGGAGNVAVFREFAHYLGSHQSVYAFQWSGWDGDHGHETIMEMASAYKEELLRFQPLEKYRLGGHCIGGLVSVELARQLCEEGIGIDGPLIVTDCPNLEAASYRRPEPESTPTSRVDFLRMADELWSRSEGSVEWSMPTLEEPSSGLST